MNIYATNQASHVFRMKKCCFCLSRLVNSVCLKCKDEEEKFRLFLDEIIKSKGFDKFSICSLTMERFIWEFSGTANLNHSVYNITGLWNKNDMIKLGIFKYVDFSDSIMGGSKNDKRL